MDTIKKYDAGSNKAGAHGPVKDAVKLENETEDFAHEHVSSELKKQIQQGRLAKKLTQAQVREQRPRMSSITWRHVRQMRLKGVKLVWEGLVTDHEAASRSCLSQLAQMINEKPQVINEYESGKAIPNPQVRVMPRPSMQDGSAFECTAAV